MSDRSDPARTGRPDPPPPPPCGRVIPSPSQTASQATAAEFAAGVGLWTGDILFAYGPDGCLYYATLAGDGQVHRIVTSSSR